jgi:hypothetical protein
MWTYHSVEDKLPRLTLFLQTGASQRNPPLLSSHACHRSKTTSSVPAVALQASTLQFVGNVVGGDRAAAGPTLNRFRPTTPNVFATVPFDILDTATDCALAVALLFVIGRYSSHFLSFAALARPAAARQILLRCCDGAQHLG